MSFTKLDTTDFVVSSDAVTAPAWSSNIPTLTTFFTASVGAPTSSFYIDVYNTGSTNINSAVQFSIAYGQAQGTSSAPFNPLVAVNTPTRVNYGQYRNIVYGDNEAFFNFGTGNTACENVIAFAIDRNRYKESLMPGTFNLKLGYKVSGTINLTDNSNDVTVASYLDCGRVYDIVSGSDGTAKNSPLQTGASAKGYTKSGSFGLFLPDIGLILLNPLALSLQGSEGGLGISWDATVGNTNKNVNELRAFELVTSGSSFKLNSQETISSDYVFARIKNAEYNYSTNPSYITGSGNLIYSDFIYSPQTYMTTVGMYNDNNELLAVAKLSKPLVKDFTKEALIRVKLDW